MSFIRLIVKEGLFYKYNTLFLYVLESSTRCWSNERQKHVVENNNKRTSSVWMLYLCGLDR